MTPVSEEERLDDPLDPETEEILQFVACDMVIPQSPYRGSVDLTNALRKRIRTLIEEARREEKNRMGNAWADSLERTSND